MIGFLRIIPWNLHKTHYHRRWDNKESDFSNLLFTLVFLSTDKRLRSSTAGRFNHGYTLFKHATLNIHCTFYRLTFSQFPINRWLPIIRSAGHGSADTAFTSATPAFSLCAEDIPNISSSTWCVPLLDLLLSKAWRLVKLCKRVFLGAFAPAFVYWASRPKHNNYMLEP